MHAIVTRFARLKLRDRLMLLMVVAMLALPFAAFAQATPEAYTSTTLLTSAGNMMTTWNLWPFVIAFAVIGLVVYLARRSMKMVR